MFKNVADEVWAFDAEWVPDPTAGRVLYDLSDGLTDREVVQEMWQRNGATEDNPMPYLKTILCRVVSIAAVIRRVTRDGEVKLVLHSLPENYEEGAIGTLIFKKSWAAGGRRRLHCTSWPSFPVSPAR